MSETTDFRIESEFFKKEYQTLKQKLLSKPHRELLYFLEQSVQTGHTPSMKNPQFYDGNIKFVKTDNLRNNYIKDDFNHYLSELGNKEIQRTFLRENDIITTIIGATFDVIARSCIVRKELLPANINQNIALIRIDKNKISSEFLNIYLNSYFGKKYLQYLSRQMEQVNLNCREVEKVIVPIVSVDFQLQIEDIVKQAHSKREHSQTLYRQAEELLLETIGLKDTPSLEGCCNSGEVNSPPLEGCRDSDGVVASPKGGVVQKRYTQNYKSLPYNPQLKERAKALRKAGMLHEVLVWNLLKKGGINGLDFDRQKIIGNYIVDFYCAEKNTVIEIDGSSHDDKGEYDARRDEFLKNLGLEVLHITAKDVLQRFEDVERYLRGFFTTPPFGHPSEGGEFSSTASLSITTPPLSRHHSKGGEFTEGGKFTTTANYNIKSFKESFSTTGRLDAEYYQPKYEEYIQLIKRYLGGYDLLQTVCNLKDTNFMPEDTKEYQYIELSDIGKSGNIIGCTLAQGCELPSRARRKINTNDVIISSIEGSLGSCALITEDFDNALCSTGFYVINSRHINSETLLVLFKSEVMQNTLKQNCSGTILTAINKTEFQNIPIPIIDLKTQQQISALIQESFALRKESERLLDEAKDMVEREIERKL